MTSCSHPPGGASRTPRVNGSACDPYGEVRILDTHVGRVRDMMSDDDRALVGCHMRRLPNIAGRAALGIDFRIRREPYSRLTKSFDIILLISKNIPHTDMWRLRVRDLLFGWG